MIYPKQNMPYYEFEAGIGAPKKYIAFLTQSGTGAPTARVIVNTLDTELVWARYSEGLYTATGTGNKITVNTVVTLTGVLYRPAGAGRGDDNSIMVCVANGAGVGLDGQLYEAPVEITVYPA